MVSRFKNIKPTTFKITDEDFSTNNSSLDSPNLLGDEN